MALFYRTKTFTETFFKGHILCCSQFVKIYFKGDGWGLSVTNIWKVLKAGWNGGQPTAVDAYVNIVTAQR